MSCFFKFYNSLQFTKVSCATRQHIFSKLSINSKFFFFKIAALGEGRKPSREEYIAESEFALLGILSKEYLMIHFYLDSSGQHERKLN